MSKKNNRKRNITDGKNGLNLNEKVDEKFNAGIDGAVDGDVSEKECPLIDESVFEEIDASVHKDEAVFYQEEADFSEEDNEEESNGKSKNNLFVKIKDRFLEFYATKAGRMTVYFIVAFVAVAVLVGIIIGVSTTKADGVSELKDLSMTILRERLPEGSFIPDEGFFGDYDATGMLVFNKKLTADEMRNTENNKYIVQYEITYKNEKGAGFRMTATCPGHAVLDPTILNLTEEYKEPIYLENVEEVKEMPIYVKVEADKSNGAYSVTLCFEKDGQVFGVTTKAANVIKAVDTLKIYVVQIVTNGSFDGVL